MSRWCFLLWPPGARPYAHGPEFHFFMFFFQKDIVIRAGSMVLCDEKMKKCVDVRTAATAMELEDVQDP